MRGLRQAAAQRLAAWAARRHGRDDVPMIVGRRRIYIIPTRFGITLALLLTAMLIAGLNYNSNLGLAFGFLMTSLALVAMHHCHRNLQGLGIDLRDEADAFAGATAGFDVVLHNTAGIERCDIDIVCGSDSVATPSVAPGDYRRSTIAVPALHRGVTRVERIEVRTRYPFGWFRAWTYVQHPLTAYVAPVPHGEHLLPAAAAAGGAAAYSDSRGDEDFSGLRTYEAGVPLKHMAWKVLARGGEPAVRSYTGVAAHAEWLDWESLPRLDPESRLSQLCRWVLDSETLQHSYGLRIPGTEIPPSRGAPHLSACLRALAQFPGQTGA